MIVSTHFAPAIHYVPKQRPSTELSNFAAASSMRACKAGVRLKATSRGGIAAVGSDGLGIALPSAHV